LRPGSGSGLADAERQVSRVHANNRVGNVHRSAQNRGNAAIDKRQNATTAASRFIPLKPQARRCHSKGALLINA
jgi:hypothetical protein